MADLLYKDKITNVTKPTKTSNLMSSSDLASKYGITYDAKAIEDKFNEATKAEYDVLRKEYEATQNKFYNNMYNNFKMDKNNLYVKEAYINDGPIMKRRRIGSRSHIDRHDKKTSHITIVVAERN